MALRTNRIVRKYAPSFYSRVRVTEGSDSDSTMRAGARSASFSWLRRTFSNGSAQAHVPLSESPKRELRMRSAVKVGRHNSHSHSKKQRKLFPRLCGDGHL